MATTTRATGRGGKPDEEFLQALYRGGELLAAGKVIEAKDLLEKAHKLQPRSEKAQNLLGLTYFKLGLFDRAAEIYEILVRENPADPTLRINLGLVYLKTNALQRAIREFETATDLAPEHKKAQNYLGLALAQAGEYGKAREHFLLAGSEAMAEKMSRAIAGETFEKPAPKPLARQKGFAEIEGSEVVAERGGEIVREVPLDVEKAPPEGTPAEEGEDVLIDVAEEESAPPPGAVGALTQQDWGAHFGGETAAREEPAVAPAPAAVAPTPVPVAPTPVPVAPAPAAVAPAPVAVAPTPAPVAPAPHAPVHVDSLAAAAAALEAAVPPESAAPARAEGAGEGARPGVPSTPEGEGPPARTAAPLPVAGPGAPQATAPLLMELVPAVQLRVAPQAGPFQTLPEAVAIGVRDELLTRLTGVLALSGKLELTPEPKRSRGRVLDKPFGEGEQQMFRARGSGVVIVDPGKQRFLSIDLGDESGYFREEVVFAFEEPVMFENGRIPSQVPPDLDLVHLRGRGHVLLRIPGPLRSLEVRMEQPVTVPLSWLVGWQGNLTPRAVPLGVDMKARPTRAGVELSGEGFALFAAPV